MNITKEQSENLFFTSDLHFYHKNIIKYADRPFKDISDMNDTLVSNWNKVVSEGSITFILGDFILTGNLDKTKEILDQLNGRKYLILGNHDYQNKLYGNRALKLFDDIWDIKEIIVEDNEMANNKQNIVLCHYPMLTWNGAAVGTWQLFGHIHSGPKSSASERGIITKLTQYDVGVDNNNFTPISYEQIKILITRKFLKID